ncbi:receptor-like protein EIX2 [Panicum virgatum]|nr:receptor-like protein EIX2 [Panicum virgatum]
MLGNLTRLDLGHNDLGGLITEEHMDGLQSLKYMYLSDNQLKIVVGSEWLPTFRLQEAVFASCQMSPSFPTWLKSQVDLLLLDISSTGISARLPNWFCNTFSKVINLDFSNNQISGGLPINMDIMSLEYLYLSSNDLTGQIPLLPRNLSLLDISRNAFSGLWPLPSNSGAPKLRGIILYSNYIRGQIPTSICELGLYALDLANNLFEGGLPQCLNMTDMTYLILSNNGFSGRFPTILETCTSLSFLDLSHNRFSGRLPMWIGSLRSLQFLRLNHNMFYGNIPRNITALTNLYHLNLAANWISGVIPPQLSNLTFMTRRYILDPDEIIHGFQVIVGELSIETKRQQLNYRGYGALEILSIDFSSNYLTGKIPEVITSLAGLVNLNLSRNQLNGEVPDKIGAMQSLESLDFSNNNLSGEIPSSISNLTFLSILDLSNNNMTGRIPSGRQLDTLYINSPSMYDGNIGLCGPPLQRDCPTNNNTSAHGDEKRDKNHSMPMSLFFGLGIGYVVGLWAFFCALLFHKASRIAYFLVLDKFYDEIYVFVVVTWKRYIRKADIS